MKPLSARSKRSLSTSYALENFASFTSFFMTFCLAWRAAVPQLWPVWLESQDFASLTSETSWGSRLSGNSIPSFCGGISSIKCVLVVQNNDHSWGYCLDAQQFLADRTAELLWSCNLLRLKGPSSPWHPWRRRQHCHRGRALVTNEPAQLTLLPNLPPQSYLQKHLICRNRAQSQLLLISAETARIGILKNQSSFTSLCFPSPTFTGVAQPLRDHNWIFMKPLDGFYCKTTLRMHTHDYTRTIAWS